MTPATQAEYAALLAEYQAVIYAPHWDHEKAAAIARKMDPLVKCNGPDKPMNRDEREAREMQLPRYLKGIGQ